MSTILPPEHAAAASLAAMAVSVTTVQFLMNKGLLNRDDVGALFEASLDGLERLAMPDDDAVRLAHALVDEQARLILGSGQPKPSTQ